MRRSRSLLSLLLPIFLLSGLLPALAAGQTISNQGAVSASQAGLAGVASIPMAGLSSVGSLAAPLSAPLSAPAATAVSLVSPFAISPSVAPAVSPQSAPPSAPAAASVSKVSPPAAKSAPAAAAVSKVSPSAVSPLSAPAAASVSKVSPSAFSPAVAQAASPRSAPAASPSSRRSEPGARGGLRRLDEQLGRKDSKIQGRSQAATLGRFYDGSDAASKELSPVSAGAETAGRSSPQAAGLQRSLDSIRELKVGTLNALHLMTHAAESRWDREKHRNVVVKQARPKSEEHRRQIAAVFKDNDLDVMILNEVESAQSLEQFNERYLGGAYRPVILPSNDPSGIATAFLVKKDIPIEIEPRTFRDETFYDQTQRRERNVFTRDLPALVIRPSGDPRPLLVVIGTHMKSKRMNNPNQQGDNMDVRKVQADRTADIVGRFQAEFGADVPILLAGDLNGEPTDDTFGDFFRRTGFVDGFDALPKKPSLSERMTHLWFQMNGPVVERQLDAVFVSKSLRALVKDVHVGRYKDASGKPLRIPSTYQERENDPSDHYPVLLNLDFQPVLRMQRAAPRPAGGAEAAGRDVRREAAVPSGR